MIDMIPGDIAVDVERERSDGGAWDSRQSDGEAMKMAKSEQNFWENEGKRASVRCRKIGQFFSEDVWVEMEIGFYPLHVCTNLTRAA